MLGLKVKTCVIIGRFEDKSGEEHRVFENTEFGFNRHYRTANEFIMSVRKSFKTAGFQLIVEQIVIG